MQQNEDIILDDENVIIDDDIVKDEPQQNNNDKKKQNNKNQKQKKTNKKINIEDIKTKLKDLNEKHPKAIKIAGGSFVASVVLLGGLYFYVSSSVGEIPNYKTDFNNQQQFQQPPKKKEYSNRTQKQHQHTKTTIKINQKIEQRKQRKQNNIKLTKKENVAISAPIIQNNKKELNVKSIKTETINKKDPIIQHIASNITNIPQKLDDKNLLTLNSEKLIENKNYEKYLQSKIQLMQKLSLYYKKTAELKKTLDLYKQVLEPKQQTQPKKQENQMSAQLKNTLSSLQQEIISLKQQVAQKEQKESQINIVSNTQNLGINSMNVYQKDGRYIVVAKTKSGDKILRVGDIYNNSKIIGITPTTITFQKGEQRYYYNTTPSFSNNYQTASIKLANTISTTNLKNNTINNKKPNVANYKQETPQDRLQMLLKQRGQ